MLFGFYRLAEALLVRVLVVSRHRDYHDDDRIEDKRRRTGDGV